MFDSAIPTIILVALGALGATSFATALIGLPLTLALLFLKKPYRFRISTYILLCFGVGSWGMLLQMALFPEYLAFPNSISPYFVPAGVSLLATQAPRKEYLKCFFVFVLPVLLLGLVSVFYPFPTRDELVAGTGVSLNSDMRSAADYLSLASLAWAFACFCWYCIWRIWRIRKEQAGQVAV